MLAINVKPKLLKNYSVEKVIIGYRVSAVIIGASTLTAGGSVIIGGIAKEMQLLPVPVVPPSVVFSNQG